MIRYYNDAHYYYSTHEKNTDKFGRVSTESVNRDGQTGNYCVYNKWYRYKPTNSGRNTTDRVSNIAYSSRGYSKVINYGYDAYGNISNINDIRYSYDEAGQLTKEVDQKTNTGKDYIYDKGGNITEVKHFEKGVYGETDTYTYGNSKWKDLLTAYNGNEITYDEIGNPLTYYNGMKFKWTMGRRLESVKNGNAIIDYTYNVDGLRTSKTVSRIKFNYFWNGDQLTAQTWPGNTLYFYYDNDGNPIGFNYNQNYYYYLTNLQGDIVAILNTDGELVAEYEDDRWSLSA